MEGGVLGMREVVGGGKGRSVRREGRGKRRGGRGVGRGKK